QWYEYTGVYGGTLWIWSTNLCSYLALLSRRDGFPRRNQLRFMAVCIALIVLPSAWSLIRYATYEEELNPANVVVVQPNVDPYGKFSFLSTDGQIENLIRLSDSVAQPNTEFFVWPETAIARQGGFDEDRFYEHPTFL